MSIKEQTLYYLLKENGYSLVYRYFSLEILF